MGSLSSFITTGKSLPGQELAGNPQVLTIASHERKLFDGDEKQKLILHFNEREETLTLNNTRLNQMSTIFGDVDPKALTGQQILLSGRQLQGGKFDGSWTIDIFKPPQAPGLAPQAATPPQTPQAPAAPAVPAPPQAPQTSAAPADVPF